MCESIPGYDDWKGRTDRDYPYDQDEWDRYEEDGPLDLEDQLENALDRAFPSAKTKEP